ncbi:hypothetical protein ACH4SK_42480 [Streptomyces inhibens]
MPGHSMGALVALVAYEVTRLLEQEGTAPVRHTGHRTPADPCGTDR